jgi:hypothetical protein
MGQLILFEDTSDRSEHFHHFIAQMIHDLHGDAPACGLVEGAGGFDGSAAEAESRSAGHFSAA